MVVDDEEDIGYLVKKALEKTGEYQVEYISRPELVVDSCLANPPELILVDIIMPNMNGRELIKALQSNPATKNILIVVTSGLGEMVYIKKREEWKWMPNRPIAQQQKGTAIPEKNAERAAEAYGVDAYLAKPFNPATLLSVVREVLEESDKRRAPPSDGGDVM